MSADASQILQPLFGRSSLHELPSAELESLISEFPFFNAAHYLLARKQQMENPAEADKRLQLAALHMNNPAWLKWLMKYDGVKFEQPAFLHFPEDRALTDEMIPERIHLPEAEIIQPEVVLQPEHAVEEAIPEPIHSSEPEIIQPEEVPQFKHVVEEIIPEPEHSAEPEIIQPEELRQTEQVVEELKEQEKLANAEEKTAVEHTVTREETPVFEPYYTIDYFASQGIRFVQEDNPNDKLGRHLKSFTEWLRTMKRLPQVPVVEQYSEETAEATINVIVDHSVEQPEVLTEAMAEVLEKQGKTEEAAEIYRKLSLLNPDKSAYFAAKIQHLKAD
jgi:hypothetical protein